MSRKKSLAVGLFAMPQAIVEGSLACLTPEQRDKITAEKAGEIMNLAVDTAAKIGRIIERADPGPTREKEDGDRG